MTSTLQKLSLVAILSALSVCPLWADDAAQGMWMTDFDAAKAKAEKEGKNLLINFTGSDWCGWCIKLDKEVFSTEAFKQNIPQDFVLVEVDFPRNKVLPEMIAKQNKGLRETYAVTGFPTVLLCDAKGRPYAKTGYQRGGADKYSKHLAKLQGRKIQRDAALAEAAGLEGPAKARALEKALSVVPAKCLPLYQNELVAIAEADPDDASGFTAKIKTGQATKQLRTLIHPLFRARNFAAVEEKVDAFIKENKPTGEALQTAMLYKLHALYMEKKYDDALKLAREIIDINDTTQPARFSGMIKKRIGLLEKQKKGQ